MSCEEFIGLRVLDEMRALSSGRVPQECKDLKRAHQRKQARQRAHSTKTAASHPALLQQLQGGRQTRGRWSHSLHSPVLPFRGDSLCGTELRARAERLGRPDPGDRAFAEFYAGLRSLRRVLRDWPFEQLAEPAPHRAAAAVARLNYQDAVQRAQAEVDEGSRVVLHFPALSYISRESVRNDSAGTCGATLSPLA
jgi:hypothetical protein